MFLAIIRVRPDPVALSATLGPLVRGVIEGMVGSAILISDASAPEFAPELENIADAAGCRLLTAPSWPEGFARAIAGSSGAPVIVLDTGVMLGMEFWPVLADHLPILGDRPAHTEQPGSGLLNRVRRLFFKGVSRECALLLPGSLARKIAHAGIDPWKSSDFVRAITLPCTTRSVFKVIAGR